MHERKQDLLGLAYINFVITTSTTVSFSLPNTTPWPGSHMTIICQVFGGASVPFFLILFPQCPKNLDSVIGYFRCQSFSSVAMYAFLPHTQNWIPVASIQRIWPVVSKIKVSYTCVSLPHFPYPLFYPKITCVAKFLAKLSKCEEIRMTFILFSEQGRALHFVIMMGFINALRSPLFFH